MMKSLREEIKDINCQRFMPSTKSEYADVVAFSRGNLYGIDYETTWAIHELEKKNYGMALFHMENCMKEINRIAKKDGESG